MQPFKHNPGPFVGLKDIVSHTAVTILAIAIAFSLPAAAKFILYQWWPQVLTNSNLMLATEVTFAALLVLIFNYARGALKNRVLVDSTKLASLVYARSKEGWLARWREGLLLRNIPIARDACILSVTGFDTFALKDSPFSTVLESAYEIRVMLVNPVSRGAQTRANSLPDENYTPYRLFEEIKTSVDYLRKLHKMGKKISLKFYDQPPFWKLVILGEHVWVQYCDPGWEINVSPEYVFALNTKNPRHGLFTPFYMHFLEKWSEPKHPEYDFEKDELVYRNSTDGKIKRVSFGGLLSQAFPAKASPKPDRGNQIATGALMAGCGS